MLNDNNEFDLIVIGGGINGAAIARDATIRGLKVILFEKHDFAYGASSKSSKLIHGGMRYLEEFHFRLVRESLKERSTLLRLAPHQVKLLPFVFPVYATDKRPLWMIKLGMTLYDFLSPADIPKHVNLKSKEILSIFPDLKSDTLQGGSLYYDAQMLDHRIVMSNLNSARKEGCAIMNHTAITGLNLEDGKITGVYYQEPSGTKLLCKGNVVVNATGAWSNEILRMEQTTDIHKVSPTKGVHLVLPQVHASHALILAAPQDSRIFFLIPWNDYSLLGTTDTPYQGDLNHPTVCEEDIDYLMTAINHYFPKSGFSKNSILASYAGFRPLASTKCESASHISRNAKIFVSPSGLVTLVGGKYTTYRKTAQEVVDIVVKQAGEDKHISNCNTENIPLYELKDKEWIEGSDEKLEALASQYQLKLQQIKHLIVNYGSSFWDILALIQSSPQEAVQICAFHPHLYAEISYVIQHEQATSLKDWFERRTNIAYLPCQGRYCAQAVCEKFGQLLVWDEATKQKELDSLKKTKN